MGKRNEQQKREQAAPPGGMLPRERLRNQWETLDLARRALEDAEKSVRYALLIFGVLNTAVVLLLTRRQAFDTMPGWARSGAGVLEVAYTVVAAVVLVLAIRSLRPSLRPWAAHFRIAAAEPVSSGDGAPGGVVLFREVLKHSRARYQQAWRDLTEEQLSAELAGMSHMLAERAHRKYESLRQLYWGLSILLALGTVIFLLTGLFAVIDPVIVR